MNLKRIPIEPTEEQVNKIKEIHVQLTESDTFMEKGFGQEERAPFLFLRCMHIHNELCEFTDSFDIVKRKYWEKYLDHEAPKTEFELLQYAMNHWCETKFEISDENNDDNNCYSWEPYKYMFHDTQKIDMYSMCYEYFAHFIFLLDCFHLVANKYKDGDEPPTKEEWLIMQSTAYCYRYFIWDMYQYRTNMSIIFAQNDPPVQLQQKISNIHKSLMSSGQYRVVLRNIFGAHIISPWDEFIECWKCKDTSIQTWMIEDAHATMMTRLIKNYNEGRMYQNIADNNIVGYVTHLLENNINGRIGKIAVLAVIHAYFICFKSIPFNTNVIWDGVMGINKNRCGGFPRFIELTVGEFGLCYPDDTILVGSIYQLVQMWIEFIKEKGSMFPTTPSGIYMMRLDDLTDYEAQDLMNEGSEDFDLDPYQSILKTDVYQNNYAPKREIKKIDELEDRY